jgi:UPF0755 protein
MKKIYYRHGEHTKKGMRVFYILSSLLIIIILGGVIAAIDIYHQNIGAVSNNPNPIAVTIKPGLTLPQIANTLKSAGVIKSTWAFEWYGKSDGSASKYLQAGTYNIRQSQDVSSIVTEITNGVQTSNLVTILPGQRIDQIETSLIGDGFSRSSVISALKLSNYYSQYPMFASVPNTSTMEGFLYPDSFDRVPSTKVSTIINESLAEMQKNLTTSVVDGFSKQGLTIYQGVTLASIVQQEVSDTKIMPTVAQVFLLRLKNGMSLGSDVTAFYGAIVAGATPSVSYNSPYNTRIYSGLPPGPISNVTKQALEAVANPSNTNYLYFVSGDNGTTYFSTTLAEHNAQVSQYCKKLCSVN